MKSFVVGMSLFISVAQLAACGTGASQDAVQGLAEGAKLTGAAKGQAAGTAEPSGAAAVAADTPAVQNPAEVTANFANTQSCNVTPNREIMITRTLVVDDPTRTHWTGSLAQPQDGAWSFGRILSSMAGSQDPQQFVRAWLAQWESDQQVNGFTVAQRAAGIHQMLIDHWPKTANGGLDLTAAPLRLQAIVNRLDLRQPQQGSAGELRFVFNVLDNQGQPELFTVILEFTMPISEGQSVMSWAQAWHALGATPDSGYNAALQALTDRVTRKNSDPAQANGSAIFRIRTNEVALDVQSAKPTWEMRQFQIAQSGLFQEVPTTLTPDISMNRTATLTQFINDNQSAILNRTYTVPPTFQGQPFLAGSSLNVPFQAARPPQAPVMRPPVLLPWFLSDPRISQWTGFGIASNNARNIVSLNTCNGCHGSETETTFLHIVPRAAGAEATLSGFLTGETVPDPVHPFLQTRTYSELQRRQTEMQNVLCGNAATQNGGGLVMAPR